MRKLILVLLLIQAHVLFAQPASMFRNRKPYRWMLGFGCNFIVDAGDEFAHFADTKNWNYFLFPSRLSFDKYMSKGFSYEIMLSGNQYTSEKLINDTTGVSGLQFAADLQLKYSLYKVFGSSWFDPYFALGAGFTYREVMETPVCFTANGAFGMNFWFSKHWAIQVQSIAKFGVGSSFFSRQEDYFQHTIGFVYRSSPVAPRKSYFDQRRHSWINKKYHFKRKNTR